MDVHPSVGVKPEELIATVSLAPEALYCSLPR
jgi:hypothetical protein